MSNVTLEWRPGEVPKCCHSLLMASSEGAFSKEPKNYNLDSLKLSPGHRVIQIYLFNESADISARFCTHIPSIMAICRNISPIKEAPAKYRKTCSSHGSSLLSLNDQNCHFSSNFEHFLQTLNEAFCI